jgi:dTDP-4-dehydrorhamnose 3,5-epimerase
MPEPKKEQQTVTPAGERVEPLPAGVSCRDIVTQVDDRGILFELFDERWSWSKDPLVSSYLWTVRPDVIKGWAVHKEHEDRYAILFGEVEVVLYDERPESPTRGLVSKIALSEYRRRLLNIPIGVWHATHNIGVKDAVLVNFPTKPYDHANPDKYRLPVNNDRIPHRFESGRGW